MKTKINKNLKYIKTAGSLFVLLLLLLLVPFLSVAQKNLNTPKVNSPLEVDVELRINKIYNINSVNETYQIDGYLVFSWYDECTLPLAITPCREAVIYENERARELLKTDLLVPAFELINVQGSRETPNIRIEIFPDGKIEYEERFFDTFSAYMDYEKFPFDSQSYLIGIEAFSYNEKELVFKQRRLSLEDPKTFLEESKVISEAPDHILALTNIPLESYKTLGIDWKIKDTISYVVSKTYKHENLRKNEGNTYSRVIFKIDAERQYGYFLWQVLFPLLIIILASFVIFWIKDFGTQIGVGFTLMLTVVAFNFYSASILPKLPYSTFIEYVIIIGYIFIFLGIIAVIINHRINGNDKKKDSVQLLKHFRYGFPLLYIVIMAILYVQKIM